jgi:hypothetical protein
VQLLDVGKLDVDREHRPRLSSLPSGYRRFE